MVQRHWKIQEYKCGKLVGSQTMAGAMFSESEMIVLLQRLASKQLPKHEIVSASLKRGAAGYSLVLEPVVVSTVDGLTIRLGDDPEFVATLIPARKDRADAQRPPRPQALRPDRCGHHGRQDHHR